MSGIYIYSKSKQWENYDREKEKIIHCVFMCHYIYYQLLDLCTDICQAWKKSKEHFFFYSI